MYVPAIASYTGKYLYKADVCESHVISSRVHSLSQAQFKQERRCGMASKEEAYANLAKELTQLNATVSTFSEHCETAFALSGAANRVAVTFDAM